jgi:uncharacterized protein
LMRRVNLAVGALESAESAARDLRDRAAALPDDAALARAELHLAHILERAWTTARAVAQRGSYVPNDLPQVFRAPFVAANGHDVVLYVQDRPDALFLGEGATGLGMLLRGDAERLDLAAARATVLAMLLFGALTLALRQGAVRMVPVVVASFPMWPIIAFYRVALHVAPLPIVAPALALAVGAHAGLCAERRGTGPAMAACALAPSGLFFSGFAPAEQLGLALAVGVVCARLFARLGPAGTSGR